MTGTSLNGDWGYKLWKSGHFGTVVGERRRCHRVPEIGIWPCSWCEKQDHQFGCRLDPFGTPVDTRCSGAGVI